MKTYFVVIGNRFAWVAARCQRHALQQFAQRIKLPPGTRFYGTARAVPESEPIVEIRHLSR